MAISGKETPMAAMGDYDSVLPFQAIGVEAIVINDENKSSAASLVMRLVREGYAVLFMEESLFLDLAEDVDKINETERLSIIPIPSGSGSLGVGVASIRKSTERAVGMDIFNVG
jgi:V/A-type H+-transporting ATPase subunit F